MVEFTQAVRERLGYYVYVLKDPLRNGAIFYVGKGKNNRVFDHARAVIAEETESDKFNIIQQIHAAGRQVGHFILRHGLDEKSALEIESACIDLLDLNAMVSNAKTTNQVKGHHSWERGLKTVDEVAQFYNAVAVTIVEPSIILNVNQFYERFMSDTALYEITRSAWKVGAHRRSTVQYAIAAYRGLVREVYEVTGWTPKGDRWEFSGKPAAPAVRDKYLNQSLVKYMTKGAQNPVRYTF